MENRQQAEKIVTYCKNNHYFSNIKNLERFIWNLVDCFGDGDLILNCLKKMTCWLDANPNRQKKNYAKFVLNWLNRDKASFEARKAFHAAVAGIGRAV